MAKNRLSMAQDGAKSCRFDETNPVGFFFVDRDATFRQRKSSQTETFFAIA